MATLVFVSSYTRVPVMIAGWVLVTVTAELSSLYISFPVLSVARMFVNGEVVFVLGAFWTLLTWKLNFLVPVLEVK